MKSVMLLFVIVPLIFAVSPEREKFCKDKCLPTQACNAPSSSNIEGDYYKCEKCFTDCEKEKRQIRADQPWANKQKRSEKCENRCLAIQPCKAPSNEDDYHKCEECFKKCDKSKRDEDIIHVPHSPVSGGIAPMTMTKCELKCTHSTECATQPSGKKCNECYSECYYKGNINGPGSLAYDQPIE